MGIKDIKNEILIWYDFYGQDISARDIIKKARTKKELRDAIDGHIHFLETQHIDAVTHADNFKKKLGL
jgi:hypothetical protein